MRIMKALFPTVLALAIALAAFAVPARAAAPAPVPTWTTGQSVGYGTHVDIGSLADTYLNLIRANPAAYNISSINALNVTGSLDSWEVDTVTEATSTYYTLGMQGAEGLKLHVAANLTLNNLPQAGTYTGTNYSGFCFPPSIPTGPGTVAVTFDATALTVTNSARRLETSNLSYINETDNANVQANVVFTGYHLPSETLNQTTCQETVTYESPTFTLTVNTQDQARLYYGSYDFFNFPISDNKTWTASAKATLGATLAGTINVQGLSTQDQAAFFDNLTKAFQSAGLTVSGLSSFPIDLAKVSIFSPATGYIINNGVVTDYPLPISTSNRAIASVQTLSDGNQYPVYLIVNESYQCPPSSYSITPPITYAAVYAPDFPATGAGMIVGYEVLVCGGSTSLPAFALTNTKPADARAKMGNTETTYQVVPSPGNPLVDFFVQAPYLGIILIAVVVVAVAALLVMRRRRRPTMAPPSPPPPPPGSP